MKTQNIQPKNKFLLFNIPFSTLDMAQTLSEIERAVSRGDSYFVITANPEYVMNARTQPELIRIAQEADLVTADGTGIVWAGKQMGVHIPGRVTGYDLLIQLLKKCQQNHWKIYILGSSQDTLNIAAEKLAAAYPDLQIAGSHHGYFAPEEEAKIISDIQQKHPHFLFVAMGSPKQELWIDRNRHRLPNCIMMGVGGCFDVIAGRVKRAPLIWQKLNIEWLYRLIQQPSRWRRMLALPKFMGLVLFCKNSSKK
ncbi:WecB/TagA/CpsF family glycosyltransferase [Microaerobacter geothermalis]|uniref:WecB/TagA/CpsF family glycosyltransferase n=1 Tax=Microaerobacter geothermalis TaxID=674972 RepID=UPI001F1E70DB|nr:WecB/TagA/CpsF family glycosyltransferase [Microaerobacter geothermalis]MCF6093285.1 WecB/TagA/CpsF family glycosyltransferase [Microaerobacter geothermalis]